MAHRMCDREQQPVVVHTFALHRSTGLESEPTADKHPGNVVVGVGVAFAKFVGPEDCGVVEHRSLTAGLRRVSQTLGEVGDFTRIPGVDPGEP